MNLITRAALAITASVACMAACAQTAPVWPRKPVKIIVPFPPGGTADSIPRIVAEKLQGMWGQPVIIDNRPGVGGNIGADVVFKSEPDGYTLLATPPGPLTVNNYLYKTLPFDSSKFVPLSLLATMPTILAVRETLPVKSVAELVDMARKSPGSISFASQGNGTTSHLTSAMFAMRTDTQLLHVPYKGTAPALSDLVGGQVDMMFDNVSSTLAQYKAGRVKVLAVATTKRLPSMPEVPTMEEAGVKDMLSGTWVAMVAPPGTPQEIATIINKAVAEVVRMPYVQKRFAELGGDSQGGSQRDLSEYIASEAARWKDVIQRAQVKVDN